MTERSDALDLETGVFRLKDPKKIAASLKRSAEASTRRKADPFRSAMSMLVFYINRAGKNLTEAERAWKRLRTSCARPSAKSPLKGQSHRGRHLPSCIALTNERNLYE